MRGLTVFTSREHDTNRVDLPLLEQARAGDADALAALCEQFYPRVLKYMHYRVNPDAAEDLTAEVLLRVVRSIGKQNGLFVAWLFRIAANVVNDHLRSRRSRQEAPMNEHALNTPASSPDPAGVVMRQHDIRKAIARLTGDQQELVTLKFIEGLTNAEIGEITNRTPEAVRALQFRALGALRDLLGSEEA